MKKSIVVFIIIFISFCSTALVFGQEVSDEARRYSDRGVAAIDMKDYEAAIKEFEKATRIAPDWPDAFYNLGAAQEGAEKYGDAVRSYREYLRLAPNADDAEEIKSLVNTLEYKAEQFISDREALDIFASLSNGHWERSGDVFALGRAFKFRKVGNDIEIQFQTCGNEIITQMAQVNGKTLRYNSWSWWIYKQSQHEHEVAMEVVSRTKVICSAVHTGWDDGRSENSSFEYNLK